MGEELDYVARCPDCRRLVMWAHHSLPKADLAKETAKAIRAGLEIGRMSTADAKAEARDVGFMHADGCARGGAKRAAQPTLFEV